MKFFLILLTVLIFTGCSTPVPVKRNFPSSANELMVVCPELKTINENTTQLSEVLKTVTENYGQYQECKIKVDAWIEWYNTQKNIFDSVK
jgi:hypothetical protein